MLEEDQIKSEKDGEIKGNKDKIIETLKSPKDPKHREIKEKLKEYDLLLRSVDTVDDLVNEGHNLVIVALVGIGTNLHIRIFGADGKKSLIRQRTS